MIRPLHLRAAGALGILLVLSTSGTTRAALKVGDPAPKIQVARWLRGEAVKEFEGDKVYIVEFWATWCGPCVASIPHLNEIHQRHKDKGLVVIGQNAMESDEKAVEAFVKNMAGKMTYRVTLDDPADGGYMARHWMTAAGQNGIPCAFVVNKRGKIAYIGHPMSLEESLLEKLLAEPSTVASPAAAATPAGPPPKAAALAARAAEELRAGDLDKAEATMGELQAELTPDFMYLGGLLELDLLLARKQTDDAVQLAGLLGEDFAAKPEVVAQAGARLVARDDATPALLEAARRLVEPLSDAPGPAGASARETLARIASLRDGGKTP